MTHFLIPARSGSKSVADKNIRDLGGRPLLAWTIETAKAIAVDAPVVVNSDDIKILDIAEGLGADVYQRPEYLGGDTTTMGDVVADYLKKHEDCDCVVLLFPCCPFRTVDSLAKAIQLYNARGAKSLMTVTPHKGRPFGGIHISDGKFTFDEHAEAFYRKQDTPALYFANGSIFIFEADELPKLNTQLFNGETVPYVLEGAESLDIDSEYDMEVATALVRSGRMADRQRVCGKVPC